MKTMNLQRLSLAGLMTASLLFTSVASPAMAEEGPPRPADSDLIGAKTVAVLPVLGAGAARKTAFIEAASVAALTDGRSSFAASEVTSIDPSQGFGFAGASTEKDIVLMRMGFLIGSLATEVDDPKAFASTVEMLGAAREVLAGLSPAVVTAYDRYVASGKARQVDVDALADLFMAASEGIAAGPQRAHGYLSGGIWFGLAMSSASMGKPNPGLASMAGPLAVLFEEDAEFEGSDRKLAASLREVAGILRADKLDGERFKNALMKVFTVEADAP